MDTPRSKLPPQTESTIETPKSEQQPQPTLAPQDQIPPQSTNLQIPESMSATVPVGGEEGGGETQA